MLLRSRANAQYLKRTRQNVRDAIPWEEIEGGDEWCAAFDAHYGYYEGMSMEQTIGTISVI